MDISPKCKVLITMHMSLLLQIFGYCLSDKIWNKCPLQSDALRLIPRMSMKECLDQCHIRNNCKMVCYRTATKLCEIHKSSEKIINCRGCVSVRREDIRAKQFVRLCGCREGQTCNTLTGSCEYTECGELSFPSGKTYGNLAYVGAKKITQCYIPIERLGETTCSGTGIWKEVSSCEDICPSSENTDELQIRFCRRKVSQEDAKRYCNAMGGTLIKLDKVDQMDAIRQMISRNPDLTSNDYWVDGYSENAMDLDVWKFSDGTQMPMDKGVFWAPAAPNDGNIPRCVRMRSAMDHLLDDRDCSFLFYYACLMY